MRPSTSTTSCRACRWAGAAEERPRGPEETPTREEALRLYTLGSAWFAHDEARRGSVEVGRMADLAVLSMDYASVPVEEIGGIESLLTMVGGRIVYAAGALKRPLDAGRPLR